MGNTVAPNTINVFMTIRHPKFKNILIIHNLLNIKNLIQFCDVLICYVNYTELCRKLGC